MHHHYCVIGVRIRSPALTNYLSLALRSLSIAHTAHSRILALLVTCPTADGRGASVQRRLLCTLMFNANNMYLNGAWRARGAENVCCRCRAPL